MTPIEQFEHDIKIANKIYTYNVGSTGEIFTERWRYERYSIALDLVITEYNVILMSQSEQSIIDASNMLLTQFPDATLWRGNDTTKKVWNSFGDLTEFKSHESLPQLIVHADFSNIDYHIKIFTIALYEHTGQNANPTV